MKRNFRYITKFEEQTRSARPERRDNAYKSVVNSYFENVGIFYENDEVNVIDDKHATTKVPQTIGGWQNSWNSKEFEVPVGLPCRPATNLPQEGWWLDYTAPKVKAFINKIIAMQVEHPEFEKNSSSTRLETREAKERVFTATSSEERGRWEIDVELNGKTVFRYDSDSHNPDEEGYEPTEGGWMKNLTDYQGLADWMSHMGVMDKGETLVVDRGSNKGRYYARSSSARLETRSIGGGGYQSLDKYQKDHHGWKYFAVYDYLPSMIDKTLKGWQIVNDEGSVLIMYNKQDGYSLEQLKQLMDREEWKLTKISDTKYSITTKKPSTTIHDSNRYKTNP